MAPKRRKFRVRLTAPIHLYLMHAHSGGDIVSGGKLYSFCHMRSLVEFESENRDWPNDTQINASNRMRTFAA